MSSPSTRADNKVSRPTTAPIISRGPPFVYFSGRLRCRIRPTAPPAKTAAVTASAKISGFIVVPPKTAHQSTFGGPLRELEENEPRKIARCVNRATLLIRRNFRPLSWPDAGTYERGLPRHFPS